MTFSVLRQLSEAGVLGMNRRNAEYIMRYNPRSAFPLVDNKLLTKQLAEKHRIPTPPTHCVVEHQGDIAGLRKVLSRHREFVVKPVRGAGGSGIVLITDVRSDGYVKPSGEILAWEELAFHLSDILSGIYSLGGLPDAALVEGLIHPSHLFSAVTYQGVPDIRIVLYRGVPVMSMVRLPTKASDGKANLHRGAIGVGVDIEKGRTLQAVHRSKRVTHHPDTKNPVSGIQIPQWKQLLLIASTALEMTGLGYLGVDLIIDKERGPVLLELNARPGLAIQIANGAGLLHRMNLVDKASSKIFNSIESRVSWAMNTIASPAS